MGSSKASFRFEAINMRGSSVSIFILGFGCVLSAPQEYPGPAPPLKYDPQIGQTNVDGYSPNTKPYCHIEEKVVFENQCEPYTEKTCWTQNEEDCKPVMYKNCTGVIQTKIDRVCFNVNELVCSLVENIHYETLEETYQVQRCFTGKDRVCDTTFKIDTTTKDDYQCINVETPNCYMEEKVINDVTCSIVRGSSLLRMMDMVHLLLSVRGHQSRIATTFPERSKWKCVRLMFTGIVRSFPILIHFQSRSKTAISSQKRSVNWR